MGEQLKMKQLFRAEVNTSLLPLYLAKIMRSKLTSLKQITSLPQIVQSLQEY